MKSNRLIILIPGLGDSNIGLKILRLTWNKFFSETVIFDTNWSSNERLEEKLSRLNALICSKFNGKKIILLGTSAGGSLALNAFSVNKCKIDRVVSVCGRLAKGENVRPSLKYAARNSISFRDSVLLCEKELKSLTKIDKRKILTVRPYYDEIVPVSTMTVDGATNIRILAVEHLISINLALTIYFYTIRKFIEKVF